MTPDPLAIARANARFELEKSLEASARRGDRDPSLLEEIGLRYHLLGIAALLGDGDRDSFARFLSLAAQTECHLRSLDLAATPRYLRASRGVPFADALTAGDLHSAGAIARLTPDGHQPAHEYEDDALRYRFMHRLLLTPDDAPALERLLARWRVVAEGKPTPHYAVSHALLLRDAGALDEAMEGLLTNRRKELAIWRKSPGYRVELDATGGSLFVLGLAYLRLAELLLVATRSEYEGMPSPARIPLLANRPAIAGSWRLGVPPR